MFTLYNLQFTVIKSFNTVIIFLAKGCVYGEQVGEGMIDYKLNKTINQKQRQEDWKSTKPQANPI